MTMVEIRACEGRCGVDPLRRVVWMVLAIYLIPVALVVLVVGGLGLGCCAVARLVGRDPGVTERAVGRSGVAQGAVPPRRLYGMAPGRSQGC